MVAVMAVGLIVLAFMLGAYVGSAWSRKVIVKRTRTAFDEAAAMIDLLPKDDRFTQEERDMAILCLRVVRAYLADSTSVEGAWDK